MRMNFELEPFDRNAMHMLSSPQVIYLFEERHKHEQLPIFTIQMES